MKVVDDFLDYEEFQPIYELMMGSDFPWFFNDFVNDEEDSGYDEFQFTHSFYRSRERGIVGSISNESSLLIPCLDKLNVHVLARMKANLNVRRDEVKQLGDFHIDFKDMKTAIFYINTNNGYTLFEDRTKIESVSNRMVIFDSNMKHTGYNCSDKKKRVLINFNYYER